MDGLSHGVVDCGLDLAEISVEIFPFLLRKDDDTKGATPHILLIREVLIARNEDVEVCILGCAKKCSILQARPSEILDGEDLMSNQAGSKLVRDVFVEKYLHEATGKRLASI